MASDVEICNMALSHVRGGSINSLDEDNIQAQTCKLFYNLVRDQVLEEVSWNFSQKISALALLTDEIFNWAYTYSYPTDCLKINNIIPNISVVTPTGGAGSSTASRLNDTRIPNLDNLPKVEYKVMLNGSDKKVIVCNEAEARIYYRAKVTNPTLFDNQVVGAISHLLASHLAIPIAGAKEGRAMRDDELSLYSGYINSAGINNANEGHQDEPDSDWILARN